MPSSSSFASSSPPTLAWGMLSSDADKEGTSYEERLRRSSLWRGEGGGEEEEEEEMLTKDARQLRLDIARMMDACVL
jgi:hypothetical protein